MNVAVVTVTWNSEDVIAAQVESVRAACGAAQCTQVIVDNASADGTVALVRGRFPDERVIANEMNRGFGAANNAGLAAAGEYDYALFLNPDMRLAPGAIDALVAWMEAHPDAGIASPLLVDADGVPNSAALPRRFPRAWEQATLVLKLPHLFPRLLARYRMDGFDPYKEQDVETVRGSCMVVRRALLDKLGHAFDQRYFIWFEDIDLCREAKRLGYRVVHVPSVRAQDLVGHSFAQRQNFWKQKQFTESMLAYFKKWEPHNVWLIALVRPFGLAMAWLGDRLRVKATPGKT